MIKKISVIIILFLFPSILYSSGNAFNKYKVLFNLCKSINDKGCELKYYSYMYEEADETEKKSIVNNVENILNNINLNEYNRIKFEKFKKNYVYFISKLGKLKFGKDRSFIDKILEEAYSANLSRELIKYLKTKYNFTFNNVNNQSNKFINILIAIPLTGRFKNIGEYCLQGVLTGIDFFGKNNNSVKIFLCDTSSNENLTYRLDKIIQEKNINVILGPLRNSVEKYIVSVAAKREIPVVSLVPKSINNTGYKYYFVHNLNLEDEILQLKDFINTQQYNLAIMYPETIFGNKLKYFFVKSGFNVSLFINYSPDAVDFKKEIFTLGNLSKKGKDTNEYIQNNNIDSVFIADDVEKALLIIPQLYFYDLKNMVILGTNLWNTQNLLKLDNKFQKNIYFLDIIDYNSQSDSFVKFRNYLQKYFNSVPKYYSVLLYDSIKIILKCKDFNNDNFRNYLTNNKFFLLTGETYFDKNGISHKKFKIFTIKNGQIMLY